MEKKHISSYWTCVICSQGQQIAFFCRSSESWDSKAGSSPSILENVYNEKNRFSEENHRNHWKHEKCRNLLWISASFSCFCCFAWQFDFSDKPIPLFDGSCCFTTSLFFSTQSCETCDKSISCLQAVNRPWTLFFSWNLSDFAVSVYLLQYLFSFFLKKMPGRWSRFSPGDQRLAAKKISKFRQRSDLVLSFMTALWCDDHDGHVSKSKWLQIIMNDSFNI